MFENADRNELRQIYFQIWQKHLQQASLEPLEQQILQIMLQHPEYFGIFNDPDHYLEHDYPQQSNSSSPFLHLSLHQALVEQLTTDRPAGIQAIYKQLTQHFGFHEAEHKMMEVLMQTLREGLQQGQMLTETKYLQRLTALLIFS